MRDMMWIYAVMIFWSEAWSLDSVHRYSVFNLGSDVKLRCSNKTWTETMFVIWEMHLKSKKCKISFSNHDQSIDSCNDGKSLQNTSSAQSYLRIPNFSTADVGVYKCESVYRGGRECYMIHVAITVPPKISAWLERKDNKLVAVCKAERGNPAANISWSHAGNLSSYEMLPSTDGLFTVESHLELPEGMDTGNLSCVISHPYWEQKRILEPKYKNVNFPWLCIPIAVVIVVFLAGFLFFAQKKQILLRPCRQSDSSPPKSTPTEDVEEVEPYASFVQRVNSIYNSSADLFT